MTYQSPWCGWRGPSMTIFVAATLSLSFIVTVNCQNKSDSVAREEIPSGNAEACQASPTYMWIIIGILVAINVILVCVIVYGYKKINRVKSRFRALTPEEISEFFNGKGDSGLLDHYDHRIEDRMMHMAQFEIPEHDLLIHTDKIIGKGQYGVVFKGELRGMPVAVKSLDRNVGISEFKLFLAELKILIHIGRHPNIVDFHGAVTSRLHQRVVYAVFELSDHGNLKSYLTKYSLEITLPKSDYEFRNPTTVDSSQLCAWCEQIAHGMEHLVEKKVIHGDLAARNILLCANKVAKITDFGLSRRLKDVTEYKEAPLLFPIAWMAPESLEHLEFSHKSDVWAFGVTMWEIFSLGQNPPRDPDWANLESRLMVKDLHWVLQKPFLADSEIYDEMLKCWATMPENRPGFHELVKFFQAQRKRIATNFSSIEDIPDEGPISDKASQKYYPDPRTYNARSGYAAFRLEQI